MLRSDYRTRSGAQRAADEGAIAAADRATDEHARAAADQGAKYRIVGHGRMGGEQAE
jgi:hypothetical protein